VLFREIKKNDALRFAVVLLVGGLPAGGTRAEPAQGTSQVGRTIWDGVYSDEQAQRGKQHYVRECSGCHMDDLSGSGQAPPLAGDAFAQQWKNQSVEDLFAKIRTSMPPNDPGRLGEPASLDVVAFLLRANGFPAGSQELTRDVEVLKSIKIVPDKRP
jgi:mono/diheme cytochrome c family protein